MTEPMLTSNDDLPQAQDSELEVLGLAMWEEASFLRARQILADEDFFNPIHREVWGEMTRLNGRGEPITPTVVMHSFTGRGQVFTDKVMAMSTYRLGDARGLDYHLKLIEDASIARHLQSTLVGAYQRAVEDWRAGDLGIGATSVADEIVENVRVVQGMRREERTERRISEIIMRPRLDTDWVIPHVIARGERIIITAKEGHGKSTLLRQIAGCVAAGRHPFQRADIPPQRVLVVDAENPEMINTEEWGSLYERLAMSGSGHPDPDDLWIEECGARNLLDPKDAAKLFDQVDRIRPALIVMGPLYQLFEANPNDEEPARQLSGILDRIRLMHNSALVIEAHTPHSEHVNITRPYGASLWKRWPEFGYCIQPDGSLDGLHGRALQEASMLRASEFVPWRGSRAMAREWPYNLTAGGTMPWESAAPPALAMQEPQDLDDIPEPEPEDHQESFDLGQTS